MWLAIRYWNCFLSRRSTPAWIPVTLPAHIQIIAHSSIFEASTEMLSKSSLLVLTSQIFTVIVHGLAKFLATTGEVDPQQILHIRMFVTLSLNSLFLTTRFPEELPLGTRRVR